MSTEAKEYKLTTVDNPYSPFTQFEQWLAWDRQSGYNTLSLLARIAKVSDELPEPLYLQEVDRAIDVIVELNPSGMHKKVVASDYNDDTNKSEA